jgi:hypothetical protein
MTALCAAVYRFSKDSCADEREPKYGCSDQDGHQGDRAEHGGAPHRAPAARESSATILRAAHTMRLRVSRHVTPRPGLQGLPGFRASDSAVYIAALDAFLNPESDLLVPTQRFLLGRHPCLGRDD